MLEGHNCTGFNLVTTIPHVGKNTVAIFGDDTIMAVENYIIEPTVKLKTVQQIQSWTKSIHSDFTTKRLDHGQWSTNRLHKSSQVFRLETKCNAAMEAACRKEKNKVHFVSI